MDYINPNTGKGWSPREEEIIEHIIATVPCARIEAIRTMRRRKLDDLRGKTVSAVSIGEPAKNSPVGVLMARLLAKNPTMGSEAARQEANRLLDKAAGRWRYVIPRVYSEQEQAMRAEALETFRRFQKAA